MNGIKRLRNLAKNEMGFGFRGAHDVLTSIADQIERELREERDRWDEELCESQMDKTRAMSVYLEMNKHVLGHDGAEDSPVARWARQLRRALFDEPCDGHAADVSMSAYDLLPQEEREAVAWVREHGGIAYVRDAWNVRSNLDRQLGKAQAKVERQQRHIEFVQRKCRERQERVMELRKLKRAYIDALNGVCKRLGLTDGTGLPDMAEVIWTELDRRLVPEGGWPRYEDDEMVLVGSDLADEIGCAHTVTSIEFFEDGVALRWNLGEPEEYVWLHPGERVKRPAPKDSWERLEEDADATAHLFDAFDADASARIRDLVRRAKALVERDA